MPANESEEQRKLRLINKKVNKMKKVIDALLKHTGLTEEKLNQILKTKKKPRPDIELANKIWAKKKGTPGYKYFDALKEARKQRKKGAAG